MRDEQRRIPLPPPPGLDEVAHHTRLVHVQYDEIAAARILRDLACGGFGLLVVVLAVNNRGEPVFGVPLNPLPHVEDGPTGRIDHDAADLAEPVEILLGHAERRQDDHILGGQSRKVELPLVCPVQKADAHLLHLPVDVRIMNDLPHEMDRAPGELAAGLVGILDRTVHPVAEPELPGQPECETVDGERVTVGLDGFHEVTVVLRLQRALDFLLEAKALAKIRRFHDGLNLHWYRRVPRGGFPRNSHPRQSRQPAEWCPLRTASPVA